MEKDSITLTKQEASMEKRSLLTKLPRDGQYMNYKTNK